MYDILALANRYGCGSRNMVYAGELAAATRGSLTGLFISEPVSSVGEAIVDPEFQTIEADIAGEAAEAARMFERWAADLGIAHHRWQVALGRGEPVLARIANWHDVLVIESSEQARRRSPVLCMRRNFREPERLQPTSHRQSMSNARRHGETRMEH